MVDPAISLEGAVPSADDTGYAAPLLPLKLAGLTLSVDGKVLVDSVDLTLSGNALTVVMGANGAAKSLLLRLMHGLLQPTAGAIQWGGAPMSDAVRRRQAMVFQRPVLLRRSVAANIDFALRLRDRPTVLGLARQLFGRGAGAGARARRDALLDHVGLLDRAKQPARLLSGGEQQRLALARALAIDPEVLLLDEPTANLDPASVQMIEEIVRAARDRGVKVVFVTHDLGQAKRLADEVVFLHKGRLVEHGPADRFFAGPASPLAAAYLEGRIVL